MKGKGKFISVEYIPKTMLVKVAEKLAAVLKIMGNSETEKMLALTGNDELPIPLNMLPSKLFLCYMSPNIFPH